MSSKKKKSARKPPRTAPGQTAPSFRVMDSVTLKGLVRCATLNGQPGLVVADLEPATGRVGVVLKSGDIKLLKPENLSMDLTRTELLAIVQNKGVYGHLRKRAAFFAEISAKQGGASNFAKLWCGFCGTCVRFDDGSQLNAGQASKEAAGASAGFMRCACKQPGLYYCSKSCQKRHWDEGSHKLFCPRSQSRSAAALAKCGYWRTRWAKEVGGEAEAEQIDLRLGRARSQHKANSKSWWRKLRRTRDGNKHRGRLELVTWGAGLAHVPHPGSSDKAGAVFFGGTRSAAGGAQEQRRYMSEFHSRGPAGSLAYFEDRQRHGAVCCHRWTCCGQSFQVGRNGCDHHMAGCMCDFCGANAPFSSEAAAQNSVYAAGLPMPRLGERGHPASKTKHGVRNWALRQKARAMEAAMPVDYFAKMTVVQRAMGLMQLASKKGCLPGLDLPQVGQLP